MASRTTGDMAERFFRGLTEKRIRRALRAGPSCFEDIRYGKSAILEISTGDDYDFVEGWSDCFLHNVRSSHGLRQLPHGRHCLCEVSRVRKGSTVLPETRWSTCQTGIIGGGARNLRCSGIEA